MTAPTGTARDERGSVTPMMIGFSLIVAMAIVLVVDSSAAYLQSQRLSTLADGAALHAVDQGAEPSIYSEGLDVETLPVSRDAARAAVRDYLQQMGVWADYPDLSVEVTLVGGRLRVELHAAAKLPLRMPGFSPASQVAGRSAAVTVVD